MNAVEIARRLRPHHEAAFRRYILAERALVIAAALDAPLEVLQANRSAARRVAAGYALLIAEAGHVRS